MLLIPTTCGGRGPPGLCSEFQVSQWLCRETLTNNQTKTKKPANLFWFFDLKYAQLPPVTIPDVPSAGDILCFISMSLLIVFIQFSCSAVSSNNSKSPSYLRVHCLPPHTHNKGFPDRDLVSLFDIELLMNRKLPSI